MFVVMTNSDHGATATFTGQGRNAQLPIDVILLG